MNVLNHLESLFNNEVISALEVEFVRFLLELNPDEDEQVCFAAAACIHAQKNGHVCLDIERLQNEYLFGDVKSGIKITDSLKRKWLKELGKSPLVSRGGELNPLVLEEERLYLHRFWKYEEELADWIKEKSSSVHKLNKEAGAVLQSLFPYKANLFEINWQHAAVCLSFIKDLLVISGGPGTGKTYTVLNIIAAQMLAHPEKELSIALAAPTGKAARRLAESIEAGKENLPPELISKVEIPDTAQTVHKLLGSDFRGSRFKYNEKNKLSYDIIVVDEASMLDITMWVRLTRAISPKTKLVVLGDKDQLASVEAGSILGDICGGENSFSEKVAHTVSSTTGMQIPAVISNPPINDSVIFLTKSYRFGEESGIQKFADAVNNSDPDTAMKLLRDQSYSDLSWLEPSLKNIEQVIQQYAVGHFKEYTQEAEDKGLTYSNDKKILCALRKGPFGVEQFNNQAERLIRRDQKVLETKEWYSGRLVMATRNDAILKVRNGEIGICEEGDEVKIKFEGDPTRSVSVARLKDYEPAYAITIHKSQGSEFNKVAIILPNEVKTILSKEILYTSVTRARQSTLIIGHEEVIRDAIKQSVSRNSGLRQKIWGNQGISF